MALFLPALLAVGLTPGDVTRSCMGEPEACLDQGWCGSARDCGAWRLREDVGSRGPAIAACQAIKSSAVEKLREGSNEAYCASKDTGLHGFRCFGGDNWVGSMASFLEAPRSVRETLDESLTLDKAGCEQLHLDGTWGGHVYMAGLCCAGWAVPCTSFDCADAFRLDTPGILRSSISIMLLIAAAVHTVSSLVCVLFGRRLLESYPSTEGMAASDKRAGQHVISMLGAAHGGFAAVLVFGALQDWCARCAAPRRPDSRVRACSASLPPTPPRGPDAGCTARSRSRSSRSSGTRSLARSPKRGSTASSPGLRVTTSTNLLASHRVSASPSRQRSTTSSSASACSSPSGCARAERRRAPQLRARAPQLRARARAQMRA